MLHVFIINKNPILRLGLRSVLERDGIQIVGESIRQDEILDLVAATQPDVVILDGELAWPAYSAAEMIGQLRKIGASQDGKRHDNSGNSDGKVQIIVLEGSPSEENLFLFLKNGAADYEPLTLDSVTLTKHIRRAANGEYLITGDVLRPASYQREQRKSQEQTEALTLKAPTPSTLRVQPEAATSSSQYYQKMLNITDREIEVLRSVMHSLTNTQIGKLLHIKDQTVKNHITHLIRKLSARNRTSAVVTALKLGMIDLCDPLPGQ